MLYIHINTHSHSHSEQVRGSQGCGLKHFPSFSRCLSPSLPGKTQGNSDTRIACAAAPANKESKG